MSNICATCGQPLDGEVRWSQKHKQHVAILELAFAAIFVAPVGIGLLAFTEAKITQYTGIGLIAVALYHFFPSLRPLFSGLADRLPFLASKTDR